MTMNTTTDRAAFRDAERWTASERRHRVQDEVRTTNPASQPHAWNIAVLAGGVGGARFLQGVRELFGITPFPASPESVNHATDLTVHALPPRRHQVTAIVNVGDDMWMHGLRICPDLDTCMYTLADGIDTDRGWGRADESWRTKEELAAYDPDSAWFGLGDRDMATHLIRTRMLREGFALSEVTEELCRRWQPGVRLIPATDDRHETHVLVNRPDADPGETDTIHFQEWWVRHRAGLNTHSFTQIGPHEAKPAPGVREVIADADLVLLAPSNPIVSIGAITSVPEIRTALRNTTAAVVGISPVVEGKPLRGMADICLSSIGVKVTAEAIAEHYGARSGTGILDGWLVDENDFARVDGITIGSAPLLMTDPSATADMIRAACALVGMETP